MIETPTDNLKQELMANRSEYIRRQIEIMRSQETPESPTDTEFRLGVVLQYALGMKGSYSEAQKVAKLLSKASDTVSIWKVEQGDVVKAPPGPDGFFWHNGKPWPEPRESESA
jgi:hypothetical protein